jgi:predicted RecA/RadA family phage recombinase
MSVQKQAIEKYDGRVIPYTCTKEVTVGDVIPLGVSMIGIAVNSGLIGEEISVELEKVWTIKAKTTDVIAVGDVLYWDAEAKELTKEDEDNVYAGRAMSSKAAVAGTVEVKLNV